MQTETNIKALKNYTRMPLAQKIEANRIRQNFFKGAIALHISIKRKSVKKALKEFRDLYDVDQFFCTFWNDPDRRDDSVKVWFTRKPLT